MTYKVITAVATEPVTSVEAKLHCKIEHTADDSLVTGWITSAREFAEHYCGRAFASQTIEMALDAFPVEAYIDLDLPPVTSVTSVKYTDTSGVEQTFSSASYSLSTYGDSRRINLAYAATWPITQEVAEAVRIRYVCGYATLPKAAKQALLLLIEHQNQHRGVTALKASEIPLGILSLLNTIKSWAR